MESKDWPVFLCRGDCLCGSTSSHINQVNFIDAPVVSVPRSLVHLQDWKMNEGAILERSGADIQKVRTGSSSYFKTKEVRVQRCEMMS